MYLARYAGPEGFEKQLVIKRVLPQTQRQSAPAADVLRGGQDAGLVVAREPGLGVRLRPRRQRLLHRDGIRARRRSRVAARRRRAGAGNALPAICSPTSASRSAAALAYVHARGFVHRDVSPRERAPVRRRRGQAVGLRPGPAVESPLTPGRAGTPSLHGARTGPRRSRRRARGHLLARHDSRGGAARARAAAIHDGSSTPSPSCQIPLRAQS